MATVPFAHATACPVPTYSAKLSAKAFASVFGSGKPPQLREARTRASACSSGSPYSGQAGQARLRTAVPPSIASRSGIRSPPPLGCRDPGRNTRKVRSSGLLGCPFSGCAMRCRDVASSMSATWGERAAARELHDLLAEEVVEEPVGREQQRVARSQTQHRPDLDAHVRGSHHVRDQMPILVVHGLVLVDEPRLHRVADRGVRDGLKLHLALAAPPAGSRSRRRGTGAGCAASPRRGRAWWPPPCP